MAAQSKWLVSVPVATLWTSYQSPREIDAEAISSTADSDAWLEKLTYETRLELCNSNLVQSQVLYGQEVIVLEEKIGWAHVLVPEQPSGKDERGYPGWIPLEQLTPVADWNIERGPVAEIRSKKAKLSGDEGQDLLELSYQTILPVLEEQEDVVIVQIPEGRGSLPVEDVKVSASYSSRRKGSGSDIADEGERFLGLPYLWGGMSSYGFDCSGFSYTMCKANGYIIPRDAHEQAKDGKEVDLKKLQKGDLLFFAYEEGKGSIHHVGIYYGEGQLLHSPKTGKTVEIIPLAGTVYEKELCAARRYGQDTEE
ncbi:NlpC/P60 family protein [Peribacillus saganii]|uniref:NlpC/P60 family protein n=1 Tax=Peribacillus saganii TaxID=2303992 RepID=A0A372LTP5_9BACI|nr:C40 family peptidase [Peribacillus saganii]RFU70924.1 NlpC/P60 family protein [Peribacillus saganii]